VLPQKALVTLVVNSTYEMLVQEIKAHWKGLLVLAGCFLLLQFSPNWFVTSVAVVLIVFFIGIPVYESYSERRLRHFVTRYIENLGHEVINIKAWENNYGVKFEANGKKYYSKFKHGPLFGDIVEWIGGRPEEIVEKKS